MTDPGRELLVGIVGDDTFGSLVVLGLGGVDAELLADCTCRLVPVTDTDAADMLTALRGWPLLFDTDRPAVRRRDRDAVVELLLRVGRLAELLPEIGSCVADRRGRSGPEPPGTNGPGAGDERPRRQRGAVT